MTESKEFSRAELGILKYNECYYYSEYVFFAFPKIVCW